MLDRVSEYCRRTGSRKAWPVHRLDRGVSGLLAFAKSAELSQKIRDQFAMHKPEREYATIVMGHVEEREGTFESYLATDKALNRFSTDDRSIGQLAITHYEVINYLKDATLVRVWLETGRRNQIRVHFSEAGHPILGDPRYSAELARHPLWKYRRIALHAAAGAGTPRNRQAAAIRVGIAGRNGVVREGEQVSKGVTGYRLQVTRNRPCNL